MSVTTLDYTQIIHHLDPNSIFTITENDYSTLVWSTSNSARQPTESEILAKNTEMINEISLDHLRSERNKLLEQSDRYSLPDFPHANDTIRTQWLTYRQQLRDITTQTPTLNLQTGEISGITWPTPPS